jgi:hypothetical protein
VSGIGLSFYDSIRFFYEHGTRFYTPFMNEYMVHHAEPSSKSSLKDPHAWDMCSPLPLSYLNETNRLMQFRPETTYTV